MPNNLDEMHRERRRGREPVGYCKSGLPPALEGVIQLQTGKDGRCNARRIPKRCTVKGPEQRDRAAVQCLKLRRPTGSSICTSRRVALLGTHPWLTTPAAAGGKAKRTVQRCCGLHRPLPTTAAL